MAACLPRMMPFFFSRKKNGFRNDNDNNDNIISNPRSSKFSSKSNISPQQEKYKVRWRSRGRATPNAKAPVCRSPSEYKSPVCSEKSVNEELYNDLAEMMLLMETFMNEMTKMKSDMESAARDELLKMKNEKAKINQELIELRCQVAVLRYQLKLADLRLEQEVLKEVTGLSESFFSRQNLNLDHGDTTVVDDRKKNHQDIVMDKDVKHTEPDDHDRDMERNIELTKRRYFTALVIARQRPGEDSLATAAELRTELNSFVGIPSFSSFA